MSSAAERNRQPLLEVLAPHLPATGTVLEIGSGQGTHLRWFAAQLPNLQWQPTETETELTHLQEQLQSHCPTNVRPVIALDVRQHPWPPLEVQPAAIVTVNTIHIMNWHAVCGLIGGAGRLLPAGARLFIYGPFMEHGRHTGEGNRVFDASLRGARTGMGLRDVEEIHRLAHHAGLLFEEMIEMPANNRTLIYRKEA